MSTETGQAAEERAAEYLHQNGYKILDRNWRTRYCEIDIVAQKDKIVWFVEVKFRKSSNQGFGYEYITPKKLKQMHFAAEMWVQNNSWNGDYQLAVVSVDGEEITFLDDV